MREEAGVRDHAVVGPHRLAVDVPGALQHLERLDHAERRVRELLAQPRRPGRIVGRYASRIPPGRSACSACFTTRHGSGRSSRMRSRSSIVDAFVDVAHLDVERHVGAEEAVRRSRPRAAAKSSRIS